ncbi:hypothetical protein ANCCAN_08895 [Ancylostoma caninum]|uniref:Uncharacterized protein n=1 Tax=Ancylostoma caninum TaxID=29170 RepID=A0A368GPY6_ANCCA|nr:hypothetical protein ANCCAN_08895 [Ancylostoma caninum]
MSRGLQLTKRNTPPARLRSVLAFVHRDHN